VADIGDLTPTSSGFRLTLTPGSGAAPEARLEDEVSLDPESRCVAVIRRTAASEQRSSYRAQTREGRTYLMREVILPTVNGMAADGIPYAGFLYAGVMIDAVHELSAPFHIP